MSGYYVPAQTPTQPLYGGLSSGGQQVVYPNTPPIYADVNQGNNYLPPVNVVQPIQQLHPLQQLQQVQHLQEMHPVQLLPQYVYFHHQPSATAPCFGDCYPGLSSCWMHRPPGEMMHLPPPPPGRPGQWVQWHSGEAIWLAPSAFV